MIMFVFAFFSLVYILIWLSDNTQTGQKIINKIINNIMKY